MGFPASSANLPAALENLQLYASGIKSTATASVAFLAANTVTTAYIFTLLDQLSGVVTNLNSYSAIATQLNTYAETALPNYVGTLSTDGAAIITAAQAAIAWVTTNFPKDSTNTYILAYKLNADGTRTMATFTPVQTAGLQTALNAIIATIS
jgi:hypothetical protein